MGGSWVLELAEVHTYYGDSHVLQGISPRVGAGEIVCLLGRNGAGKTTTIRTIMGFTPPRRGAIALAGTRIDGLPPHRIARLGIGLVPQGRRIFPTLTVRENLLFAARAAEGGWDLDRVFALFPRLRGPERQRAGSLSGGEQQMLAIGRALLTNPRLLLLDEPSEGLAPILVQEIAGLLPRLRAQGLSLLTVEQNLPLALAVADRIYVLNKGRIVFEGSPDALWHDEEVKHQYLGV